MVTRKKLLAQMEDLKQDNAVLRLLLRSYMRRNRELEEDIAVLNASIDCLVADKERYQTLLKKSDERRKELCMKYGISK